MPAKHVPGFSCMSGGVKLIYIYHMLVYIINLEGVIKEIALPV